MEKKTILFTVLILIFMSGFWFCKNHNDGRVLGYGAPPIIDGEYLDGVRFPGINRLSELINWKRPTGPLKVGLQVGHWKNDELPDELEKLRGNTGAESMGVVEWEVNLAIANKTREILEKEGVLVDLLPATIPPFYWADAFVAIHADGNSNPQKSGFKVAGPWRDFSGRDSELVGIIEEIYEKEVGFSKDPEITRNMKGYYAFAWWRFEHALNPRTPAAILEAGFLTNPDEAKVLINHPEIPAKAIAKSLLEFLQLPVAQ